MSAPLNNDQKRYLSQLAERAFNRASAMARGQTSSGLNSPAGGKSPVESYIAGELSATAAAEQFRHEEVAKACGKLGLRCASQDDYKAIVGHFQELLGNHGAAFRANMQAQTETRRVIEYKITEACRQFGFRLSYADKICRAQNRGLGLEDVSEKRLWTIFYTIRNRGNARKKQVAETVGEF